MYNRVAVLDLGESLKHKEMQSIREQTVMRMKDKLKVGNKDFVSDKRLFEGDFCSYELPYCLAEWLGGGIHHQADMVSVV